jgi:hypothetical protein
VSHAALNTVIGAVFNLNHPAHVGHWHFIKLPLANVLVIVSMLVVFAIALFVPFPGGARRAAARRDGGSS